MVFWPLCILAEVRMGILEVVYEGLILVASKLVEELLQTMVVVSQLCVVWVVSQYGMLVVTVVVVPGAHVVGLGLLQSTLLAVQVNLALWWSCSICTSGSKLSSQRFILAVQCPMSMFAHVSFTSQSIPVSDIGLKMHITIHITLMKLILTMTGDNGSKQHHHCQQQLLTG